MVCVAASTVIDAPPRVVHDVFTDIEDWPRVFPAIMGATVTHQDGPRRDVLVDHREGTVTNILTAAGPDLVILEERKRHYDVVFFNRFWPVPGGGTRFEVLGVVTVSGWRRLLRGAVRWYGRRQLMKLTLLPVKSAAEAAARTEQ